MRLLDIYLDCVYRYDVFNCQAVALIVMNGLVWDTDYTVVIVSESPEFLPRCRIRRKVRFLCWCGGRTDRTRKCNLFTFSFL